MCAAIQADAIFPGSCPDVIEQAREQRAHAIDLAHSENGYAPLRGYSFTTYADLKATGAPVPPFTYLNKYRTGSHLKYVYKLADWCRDNNVELVIVDMPVTADLEAQYATEFAEYRTRLAEVERACGVTVIRDARSAGLGDAQFADLIHLRPDGGRTFSAWLRTRLEEAGR
jgi:hypothetical protein